MQNISGMAQNSDLKELAKVFLKLGIIGFGGPAAHIAMMRDEVVKKRPWLSEQHFLDLLGATNLIPGPNSTEMAIHVGHEKAGWKGLLVSGVCFILPAVLITAFLAWLYGQYGQLPQVQPFIYGIKPAIIAIIAGAVFPLAKRSLKSAFFVVLGILVLAGALLNIHEIWLMLAAGVLAIGSWGLHNRQQHNINGFLPFVLAHASPFAIAATGHWQLFWIFLKIGSILYGSGYVLFAFLDSELVAKGLLSREMLMDAVAVGQVTPGPVFSTVTFIGYQIEGWPGAVAATLGVFVPAFLFVALLNPLVKKMRGNQCLAAFLDGVNVAAVAVIAAICIEMAREAVTDWRTILIAAISFAVVFGWKQLNSAWIVLGGGALGYLFSLV